MPDLPKMNPKEQTAYDEALRRIEECRRKGKGGTTLDLRSLGLSHLPPEIGQLTALTQLSLSWNQLSSLPPEIGKLAAMKRLFLSSNQLSSLPPEIGKLTALTTLDLSVNLLSSLPPEIAKLTALTTLSLSINQLSSLPPEIAKLTALTTLSLARNQLSSLPPEIAKLTALTTLDLSWNQLSSLPPEIGKLKQLKELYLSINQLTRLPLEIGRLTALTRLHLGGNLLMSLPPEIGKLTVLKELQIHDNKFSSLPPEIAQLTALTQLDLASNQITSLPPEIAQLTALTQLTLGRNQIMSLPPEIAQLTALRQLDLTSNQITNLPPETGQLTSLTSFYLSSNEITNLPPEIGQLTALTLLALGSNQLTNLPPEIGQMTLLMDLYLSNNQLASLPPEIGQLKQLKALHLSNNQLTSLPPEIGKLTALKELYLHENPGLGLLREVLGPTFNEVHHRKATPANPREILDHYFAQRRGTTRPLNEVKVLVVGESEVGKTSLIRQLRGESYNDKEDKTHGIERHRLMLNCGRLGEVRLNVWDFGGQDIMHATHQFFLSRRSVYVLVLDSRQNERQTRIDYWLRLIASYGGDSPVIVVCNKADQQVMQLNWTALQREHPQIKFFAREVCCYHVGKVDRRKGLEELRQFIARAVEQHVEEVDRPMLDTWLDLKNELETDGRPYLTLQEYHALASERGIADEKDRDLLLTLMHRLGSVLHFSEHAIFEEERARRATPAHVEELNVLDPGWVTGAIYRLLNDAGLIRAGGRMDRGSMRAALATLPGRCYPESKEDFIIAMMRRFEICFAFDGEQDQWFLPDLLPMDEVDTGDWQGAMTFRYQYKVLPGSVMGRFLVRLHGHIANRCLWRTGAKFRKDQTEALVRSNTEEARVDIFIRGGSKRERQDFLALIRGTLEDIHRSFSGHLPVEEQISIPKHPEVYVDYKRLLLMEANGTPGDLVMVHDKLEGIQVAEVLNQVTDKTRRNDERRRRAPQIINNHYYGAYVRGNQSMSDQHIQIGGNAQGNAFGHGSHVTTTNSFNSGIQDETLKQLFETLTAQLQPLRDEMKGRDIKALDEHLEVLKAEAEKPEAERDTSQISVSGKGLIEAAKTVKDIAGPVITTAGLILEFLGVSLP